MRPATSLRVLLAPTAGGVASITISGDHFRRPGTSPLVRAAVSSQSDGDAGPAVAVRVGWPGVSMTGCAVTGRDWARERAARKAASAPNWTLTAWGLDCDADGNAVDVSFPGVAEAEAADMVGAVKVKVSRSGALPDDTIFTL